METVRPVTPPAPSAASDMPTRTRPAYATNGEPERRALQPAVSLALSDEAARTAPKDVARPVAEEPPPLERGFERDRDTQALVYRLTDAVSGDVILQFPDEAAMKARAYARQAEASLGETVARTA